MSTPYKSTIINTESLTTAVTDRVTFNIHAPTSTSNSIVFVSVIIIMAIIMVIGCVVCSIIIGIIIRSRNKTQYGLANKMITVNAENKDDDTITESSKEMKTFKNEAYGCLRHGTNRIANADLQNIQMQDQESAEDQAYEYIS